MTPLLKVLFKASFGVPFQVSVDVVQHRYKQAYSKDLEFSLLEPKIQLTLPAVAISYPVDVGFATRAVGSGTRGEDAPGVDISADLEAKEDHLDLGWHQVDRQLGGSETLPRLTHKVITAVKIELCPIIPGIVATHHVNCLNLA